jgi:hypothetical protein
MRSTGYGGRSALWIASIDRITDASPRWAARSAAKWSRGQF